VPGVGCFIWLPQIKILLKINVQFYPESLGVMYETLFPNFFTGIITQTIFWPPVINNYKHLHLLKALLPDSLIECYVPRSQTTLASVTRKCLRSMLKHKVTTLPVLTGRTDPKELLWRPPAANMAPM